LDLPGCDVLATIDNDGWFHSVAFDDATGLLITARSEARDEHRRPQWISDVFEVRDPHTGRLLTLIDTRD
jgi:hypothetical protein